MRWRRRLLILVVAFLAGLALAEAVVRIGQFDFRMFSKGLYYASGYGEVHAPDLAPRLHYRLKANASTSEVHINSHGARGAERDAEKPEGVYRIVVVGGSNVFGDRLLDDEAWPAQLERALSQRGAGRYEVWNFGTPAYVPSQMTVIADEAVEKLRPDLVIFALSNKGTRAFLRDQPIKPHFPYFSANWPYFLTPSFLHWPPSLSYETNLTLIRASALYRLVVFYRHLERERRVMFNQPNHEEENVEATHQLMRDAAGKTQMMLFVPPSSTKDEFQDYYDGVTPLMILTADGKPDEYRDVHGPAPVMAWYGEQIADWLMTQDWFPESGSQTARADDAS